MATKSSKSDKNNFLISTSISLIALLMAILGYMNSRAATNQAIASDHLSQRAWIQIHEPRMNVKEGVPELQFALKNDGKTPALDVVTEEWYTDEVVSNAIFSASSSKTHDPAVSPSGDSAKAGEHQTRGQEECP
jgi:hypothetical protein